MAHKSKSLCTTGTDEESYENSFTDEKAAEDIEDIKDDHIPIKNNSIGQGKATS